MATNPMQRKARNSFLLGMLVMLLISGIVIALLFMQLLNRIQADNEELANSVNAYVLNQDVRSGQVITTDMLTLQTVNKTLVPSNATSDISMIENYALQDKEGNDIYTKYDRDNNPQLYITIDNTEYEVEQEKYFMPLSMNIHHAVADGFHLSRFFIEVQELIYSLGQKNF